MATLVELNGRSVERFAGLVAGVGEGQWSGPTPCSEWDVRALVHHVLYELRWAPSLFAGRTIEEVGDEFEGDLIGADPSAAAGAVREAGDAAHAAIAEPGALERTVHLSFGDTPGAEYATQLTFDLVVHGWDLARATGQDESVDPDAVAFLLPWVDASAELLAGSGLFAPPSDPGAAASDAERLLRLVGRTP